MEMLYLLIGLVIGGVVVGVIMGMKLKSEKQAQADKEKWIEKAEEKLREAFDSLAGKSLRHIVSGSQIVFCARAMGRGATASRGGIGGHGTACGF